MKKMLCVLSVVAAATAFGELKIGTIDMFMLVRNHKNYDTNKATVLQTEKDFSKKMDALREAADEIQQEGMKLAEQARNPMLAQSEKTRLEKQLMGIQQKLMTQQQKARSEAMRSQQDIQALEARLLKVTTDDLRKYVDAYAKANGYTVILDKSAAAFSLPESDVTMGVLKDMGVENPVKPGEDDAKGKADEGK